MFPKDNPRQINDYDCGMFVIMYAECMSAGKRLDSCQAHVPRLRAQVAYQLKDQHTKPYLALQGTCRALMPDLSLIGQGIASRSWFG